jgi:hypothetical protein
VRSNQNEFCCADYATFTDPVLLQGHRTKARSHARQRAIRRILDAHRAEFEAIFAEEREIMEQEFLARLEATARKVAQERGAA